MCKRGDVYFVELPKQEGTSIQYGTRPFVITQNDKGNEHSPTVFGYSITSSTKKSKMPTHVYLTVDDGMDMDSHVICEQPFTVAKKELGKKICTLSEKKMKEIDRAVLISHQIKLEEYIKSDKRALENVIESFMSDMKTQDVLFRTILKYYRTNTNDNKHKFEFARV